MDILLPPSDVCKHRKWPVIHAQPHRFEANAVPLTGHDAQVDGVHFLIETCAAVCFYASKVSIMHRQCLFAYSLVRSISVLHVQMYKK